MDMNLYSRPRRHKSDSRTASAGHETSTEAFAFTACLKAGKEAHDERFRRANAAGHLIWDFSWPAR
jgi:hypothetical protein